MTRMILAVSMIMFLAPAADAADGVLEINQACVGVGCFSGDSEGFPVEITVPGSYRLTSDLVLLDADVTGIEVAAPSVSIDLGGFEITTVACLGATSDCTPESGTGYGIRAPSSDHRGISVTHGSITGMGSDGVELGDQAKVTRLRVRWNKGNGIESGENAMVSDNQAYGNSIVVGAGSLVTGNTSTASGGNGIFAGEGSTISGNTAYLNELNGIEANGDGSTISGNTTYDNGQRGDGDGSGIKVFSGSLVSGNTMRANRLYGIASYSSGGVDVSGYTGNVISNNAAGTVFGSTEELGANVCNSNTTCP